MRNHLHATYFGRRIECAWPARSPELNPLDFFWILLKSFVYETLVATVDYLTSRILVASADIASTPDLFDCIRQSFVLRCWLCYDRTIPGKEFHPLNSCPKFKSISVSERVDFVKANHLCFKCFSPNCNVKSCCAKNCFCGKPHNRLVHFPKSDKEFVHNQTVGSVLNSHADVFEGPEGSDCVVFSQDGKEENKSFVATSFLKNKTRTVLLSSVQCYQRDRFGILHEVTDLTLSQIINVSLNKPSEIKLADFKFNIPGKIAVLLGTEIFYELLRPGQIYCGDSRLLLQNTVFGYIVSGNVGDEVRDNKIHCGLIRDSDLNTTLKSLRALKSIGVKNENCNSEEDVNLGVFKQRVHFKSDRYEVELPWKRDSDELSDNFKLEKRRL
ncbi:uncharacterized protein TNCV_666601 [Trichonephila clavipes]|uniref:Peptidase aspartic putative domain-containing protein n=1 Tax=Trichonephila clavipes TaxID=2585209 RepID=A0A8X6SUB4_TRICX|nr:uncharacterized protein TNCV_666601 [Trichonephila clavipes]